MDWRVEFRYSNYHILSVSVGDTHVCLTREYNNYNLHHNNDKAVVCSGRNDYGQAVPTFTSTGTFSAVSAGGDHSCGIQTDGALTCWGHDVEHFDWRQTTPMGGYFESIDIGSSHGCGVRTDGTVACWGANSSGQAFPPRGLFQSVSAGAHHNCGVRTDGTVVCWGNNGYGRATPLEGSFQSVRGCLKRVQLVWTHEGREGGVGRSVGVWNDQLIPATSATENGNCGNPCYLRPSRAGGRSPTRDGRSSTPSATCCAPAAPGGCCPMTCRRGALCSITSAPGVGTELGSGPTTRCTPCCGRLRAGRPAPARPSSTASR